MGQFRIEISAVGAHGCNRTAKAGEFLYGRCHRTDCPDCLATDFVERLSKTHTVDAAMFTHWPDTAEEVQDDLLAGKRAVGSFRA